MVKPLLQDEDRVELLLPLHSNRVSRPVNEPNATSDYLRAAAGTALVVIGCIVVLQSLSCWLPGPGSGLIITYGALQEPSDARGVNWKACGEGLGEEFQCARISVPLDYRNSSDKRTIKIAVTRLLASDKKNR